MKKWTIGEIKAANAAAGHVFFSRDTMKFFKSKVFSYVYQGPGGVAFVTRETFEASDGSSETTFKARQFDPETGHIQNNDGSRTRSLDEARAAAKAIAAGE